MAGVTDIVSSVNSQSITDLREAAKDLFKYVTFYSKDKVINATANLGIVATTLEAENANAQMVELLLGNSAAVPMDGDTKLEALISSKSIRKIGTENGSYPLNFGLNSKDETAFAVDKAIVIYAHSYDKLFEYGNTNTDLSALFLNITPPIEMSLCTPYVDIQFLMPTLYETANKGATFTTAQYLPLALSSYYGSDKSSFQKPKSLIQGLSISNTAASLPVYASGMELFQSPQTMTITDTDRISKEASNGISILDPFAPPASLESISISQIGAGGGVSLSAETKIDMKIVVHDKSRLADLSPLLVADIFPSTTIRLTYGWSHPDINKFSNNKFGKLLNAMRYTQDLAISKTSISSGVGNNVNLNISLVSKGVFNSMNALVIAAPGNYIPSTILRSYIGTLEKYFKKTEEVLTPVGTEATVSIDDKYTAFRLVEREWFVDFKIAVAERLAAIEPNIAELKVYVGKSIKEFEDKMNATPPDFDAEFAKLLNFSEDTFYSDKMNINVSNFSGTDLTTSAAVNKSIETIGAAKKSKSSIIPMYAAIVRFVAAPLAACLDDIDEVRIHLMSFNNHAGYFACENIGMFPIDMLNFNLSSVISTASPKAMMSKIANQASMNTSLYFGYNDTYDMSKIDPDDDSEELIKIKREKLKKDMEIKSESIYNAISGNISKLVTCEKKFVCPRVQFNIDIVQSYSDGIEKKEGRVLRIIVYDDANAGSNSEGLTILAAAKSAGVVSIFGGGTTSPSLLSVADISADAEGAILKLKADKAGLRKYLTAIFPTITIGSESSLLTSAQFSSQPGGDVQSMYLLSALLDEGISTTTSAISGIVQDIDIIPASLSLSMVGNPLMARGQVYYIDFGTGTTIDNSYSVQTVTHTINKGEFKTSVTMMPVNTATMRSAIKRIETLFKAKTDTVTVAGATTSTEASSLHRR